MTKPGIDALLAHQTFLRRVARDLVADAAQQDDLVQETWKYMLARPPRHDRNLRAWIRTIARHIAVQLGRRKQLARERTAGDDAGRYDAAAGDVAERREFLEWLGHRARSLHEPYRSVLLLRYYEDLTPTEISRSLGRPLNTVNSQLQRGLALLRSQLDEGYGEARANRLCLLVAAGDLAGGGDGGAPPEWSAEAARSSRFGGWLGVAAAAALASATGWFVLSTGSRSPEVALRGEPTAEADELVNPSLAAGSARRPAEVREVAPGPAADSPAPEETEEQPRLLVTVRNESGRPEPGARVSSSQGAGQKWVERGVTDDAGTLVFDVAPEDLQIAAGYDGRPRVMLLATVPGRVSSDVHHVLPGDGAETAVTLTVGGPGWRLAGRVVDGLGEPVARALIAVGLQGGARTEADGSYVEQRLFSCWSKADGRFALAGLPEGRLPLTILADGYERHAAFLESATDAQAEVAFELTEGARVHGIVRTEDGAPCPGAQVHLELSLGLPRAAPASTQTADDGSFELVGLPTGEQRLWATHPEDPDRLVSATFLLSPGQPQRWEAILEQRVGFLLAVRGSDGKPLGAAFLRLECPAVAGWERQLTTDEEGRADVYDAPDADLVARVFRSEAEAHAHLPPLATLGPLAPSAEVQELVVDANREAMARVFGTLVDSEGLPPAYARMYVREVGQTTMNARPVSPETGDFEVFLAPDRTTDLLAWVDRGTRVLEALEPAPGEEINLGVVQLDEPGRAVTTWDWPGDADDYSFRVIKLDLLTKYNWMWLMDSGPGPLPEEIGLLPGLYFLDVERGGERVERQCFLIEAGEGTTLASGPTARALATIRVVAQGGGEAGEPVEVEIYPAGGDEPVLTRSLAEGVQDTSAALPLGEYVFEATTSSGLRGATEVRLDGVALKADVTITLR
ncbi:MAG: sigma-70 family RNA polymerase sigma factor [Planctomycetota bacterium]